MAKKKKKIFKDIIGVWFLFRVIWRFLIQFSIHFLRNFWDILTCRLKPSENNFYTEHSLQEEKIKVYAKVKNGVLNKWEKLFAIRLFVTHMDYSITRFRFAFMPPPKKKFFSSDYYIWSIGHLSVTYLVWWSIQKMYQKRNVNNPYPN